MAAGLLDKLSQSKNICTALLHAEEQELHWFNGVKINEDIIVLKATINKEFWTISLEVDHGSVVYRNLDKEGLLITISTIPNTKYLSNKSKLSADEIETILLEHSNTIVIDLKDIASLKKAKELLKEDYVLKHIPLANPTQDCAARLVIWHIRAYRKLFLDYQNKFGFLWQETGFENARSLAAAMRGEGLI